jgi:hypothetical protein
MFSSTISYFAFFAAGFFAAGFFAAVFFAVVFFTAVAFFAAGFFAVVFFAVVAFLAAVAFLGVAHLGIVALLYLNFLECAFIRVYYCFRSFSGIFYNIFSETGNNFKTPPPRNRTLSHISNNDVEYKAFAAKLQALNET